MLNLGLSQSRSMQKLNQKCISVRGGYVCGVAKQLHASKSVEFKQWKGSSFPGDSFQCRACHKGAPAAGVAARLKSAVQPGHVRARVCGLRMCVCVCFFTVFVFVCVCLSACRLCV